MILEAIGIVAASVTVITVASLRLVSVIDRRERAFLEAPEPVPTPPPRKPRGPIMPYQAIYDATPCIKCSSFGKGNSEGPQCPAACKDVDCVHAVVDHLHVWCKSCDSMWFMATADSVDKAS